MYLLLQCPVWGALSTHKHFKSQFFMCVCVCVCGVMCLRKYSFSVIFRALGHLLFLFHLAMQMAFIVGGGWLFGMVCLFTPTYLLCNFTLIDVAWMPPNLAVPYNSGVSGVNFWFVGTTFGEPCLSELFVNSCLSPSTRFPFHCICNPLS